MERCKCCEVGEALVVGKTNDAGITLLAPNRLMAYGYNVHGYGGNTISIRINYCPMCGKKLIPKGEVKCENILLEK